MQTEQQRQKYPMVYHRGNEGNQPGLSLKDGESFILCLFCLKLRQRAHAEIHAVLRAQHTE